MDDKKTVVRTVVTQKYEYKEVLCNDNEYLSEVELNELGELGWMLVSTSYRENINLNVYIFMRMVQQIMSPEVQPIND